LSAFLYTIALQWKLDIRSKALLITCYLVPLLFFAVMGGIFSSVMPDARYTLIQNMTVFGVSMAALIGVPQSIIEIYGSEIKKSYAANNMPLSAGVTAIFLSSFVHLLMMSAVIFAAAPLAFNAELPANVPLYFAALALFVATSLCIGCALGLLVKEASKLTMITQLIFLPSIILSGIMFPLELLPRAMIPFTRLIPATWGNMLLTAQPFVPLHALPLLAIFAGAAVLCAARLKKIRAAA
jgi:ABC-2 type transport system permease protein